MTITVRCTGCRSALKLRDDLAGKKIKCPRCQAVLPVPKAEEEDLVETTKTPRKEQAPAPKTQRQAPPPAKTQRQQPAPPKTQRQEPPEESPEDRPRKPTGRTGRFQAEEPLAKRKQRVQTAPDEDLAPKKEKGKKKEKEKGKYKPCPRCGSGGATRVKWTPWGSFYGPAILSHVECPECAYCYNGKTGRSNVIGITIFVLVPLIGILGVLGGIGYLIVSRGYLN